MDWRAILGTAMPMLAEIIPGGKLVGLALKTVTSALGLPESADEETIAAAVQSATPAERISMRLADQSHALAMIQEANRAKEAAEKTLADDRANARAMATAEIAADKSPWWAPTRRTYLAFIAVGGFLGCLAALFYRSSNPAVGDPAILSILTYALGTVNGIVLAVYSFDFGDTQSSEGKDNVISRSNPPTK